MAYQPIENYGIIGNMRTVALVGMDGSMDWYCYPHFDSPSVFGAILDDKKGGRFRIYPRGEGIRCKQFYWPETNILVTRFFLADGIAELQDFMPVGLPPESPWYHVTFRRVRCVKGSVGFTVECTPAFDYGRAPHRAEAGKNGVAFRSAKLCLGLSAAIPFRLDEKGGAHAEFSLNEGESRVLVLRSMEADETNLEPPREEEAEEHFQGTVKYWRKWLSRCTYRGRWREQVYRSALALKLLTFEPTGAIVAAPTCSLPEVIGGGRNWDYRYTWIRDAAFTIYAFLRIGFTEEATEFMNWMKNCAARSIQAGKPAPVVYTIHGDSHIPEITLDHWEGYRGSGPVRIGNGAYIQFQNDIYGELFDAFYLFNKYVTPISYDLWQQLRKRLNWICENWMLPDDGIWEVRSERQHFVYSKVMNWVALDRGIRLADKRSFPSDRDRWLRTRDQIYEEVMTRGWNEQLKTFTQVYDGDELDASLLIMPLVFFMSPNDPRMTQTLASICRSPSEGGLLVDGLVYRYPPGKQLDGLTGMEGTFNMCTFWLVEALSRAGGPDCANLENGRLLFERMLGYANHLGLYAEQTGSQGEALGNFPQAFTHLAQISAAFNLDRILGGKP